MCTTTDHHAYASVGFGLEHAAWFVAVSRQHDELFDKALAKAFGKQPTTTTTTGGGGGGDDGDGEEMSEDEGRSGARKAGAAMHRLRWQFLPASLRTGEER